MAKVSKSAGEVGYNRNREGIEKAYKSYQAKEDGWETELFDVVTRFAKSKISSKLFNSDELADTPDDYAQDIVIKVWQQLDNFDGNASEFYSWVHKICFYDGKYAYRKTKKKENIRIPLLVESEEFPDVMEDNPVINQIHAGYVYQVGIPTWVEGTDLHICVLIRDGMTYKMIAEWLGITENAVEHRVRGIRQKVRKIEDEKIRAKSEVAAQGC